MSRKRRTGVKIANSDTFVIIDKKFCKRHYKGKTRHEVIKAIKKAWNQ